MGCCLVVCVCVSMSGVLLSVGVCVCVCVCVCVLSVCVLCGSQLGPSPPLVGSLRVLAFTRYSFTSSHLCTNQLSFYSPPPSALLTLLQYCCTTTVQDTPLPRTLFVHAIQHTILAMAILCKGQFGCPPPVLTDSLQSGAHQRIGLPCGPTLAMCKTINSSHAHRPHRQRKHPRHQHTHAHDKTPKRTPPTST